MLILILLFISVRGQEQCIAKKGYKTKQDTYNEIAKKNSAINIDLCEKECIKVLLICL